jgi:hypothetical protein
MSGLHSTEQTPWCDYDLNLIAKTARDILLHLLSHQSAQPAQLDPMPDGSSFGCLGPQPTSPSAAAPEGKNVRLVEGCEVCVRIQPRCSYTTSPEYLLVLRQIDNLP